MSRSPHASAGPPSPAVVLRTRRLARDAERLRHTFNSVTLGGEVEIADLGSDPHDGGGTVAVVRPRSGGAVVYKPRSLAVDVAFARLLAWYNDAAPALPPLRAVRTLDRGAYGWAEYATTAPCADAAALRRYYERAGALLAVAYVLRLGDLHSENVVAAGEHPLLIDLEAALAPVVRAPRTRGDADTTSVLDTGLLPLVYVAADGRGFVEGGIAPVPAARGAAVVRPHVPGCGPAVAAVGVAPHVRHVPHAVQPGGPVGSFDGDAVSAAVQRGFRRAYRVLLERRGALLARGGPLAAFAGTRTRVVLRATSVYAAVLRRLAAPALAGDPRGRAAEIDRLHRPFRERPGWTHMVPAFAAEATALERCDVPRFEMAAGGTGLRAGDRVVVPGYAGLSGLAAVRRRVRALSAGDRVRQLAYVRIAFAAEAHRRAGAPPALAPSTRVPESALEPAPELTVADGLAECRALATLLARIAVPMRDGRSARWQGVDPTSGADRLMPLGVSLGDGQAGIGLAFAALARVTADAGAGAPSQGPVEPGWAEWARRALAPVVARVHRGGRLGRLGSAGYASGAGGVAYALCAAARWLGDDVWLDAARAALATGVVAGAMGGSDVFGGTAGLVFGLLAYHDATRDPWALAQAAACGAAVAAGWASRAERGRRRRHGVSPDAAGFGFGAAGRAAALLHLAARTGCARHAATGRALLASAVAAGQQAGFMGGWCHGEVGVGLALAAALAANVAERDRWAEALDAVARRSADTGEAAPRAPYTACCGTLARIDLLVAAGDALAAPAHHAAARRMARTAVARARRRLAYHTAPHLDPFAPSLFGGLAGVVYTLLRTTHAAPLPCVLAGAEGPV